MMFTASRMEHPDPRWSHPSSTHLGWPVGEPPPPPPSVMIIPGPSSSSASMMIEAGLITPPYGTDSSSLELRSPDIIPPPILGSND